MDDSGKTSPLLRRGPAGRALLSGLVLLGLVIGCGSEPTVPSRVVLVTVDTLRPDHLGSYGYPRPVSPYLDRLASESLRFRRVVASMAHTAPSHASLFTGLHPAQHRLLRNGEELDERLRTLPEFFAEAGFRTAGFTSVGFLEGFGPRFEVFRDWKKYRPADVILGNAAAWIRDLPAGERCFVWIHLFDVHQWYQDRFLDPAVLAEVRELGPGEPELESYLRKHQGVRSETFRPGKPGLVQVHDRYDGQILRVDRALERFFAGLSSSDHGQPALWILTSDHGEGLGSHRFKGHGISVYNEQLQVPLIVHFTDRRFRPRVVEEQVQLVDLAPTLAEWFRLPLAQPEMRLSGQSLVSLIEGRASDWNDLAFAQRRPVDDRRLKMGWKRTEMVSLQSGGLKVILRTDGEHEVYDLAADPLELENRFDREDPAAERLFGRLRSLSAELSAEGATLGEKAIRPEHVEELEALGYL